jgi:hypothetical protein
MVILRRATSAETVALPTRLLLVPITAALMLSGLDARRTDPPEATRSRPCSSRR